MTLLNRQIVYQDKSNSLFHAMIKNLSIYQVTAIEERLKKKVKNLWDHVTVHSSPEEDKATW